MYILSNGVKITEKDHERLYRALRDTSEKYLYFLDMKIGKLVKISQVDQHKIAIARKNSKRFVSLPKVTEKEIRKEFVVFVEELGIIDVPELQERLSREIKKETPLKKLVEILEKDPSGWIYGWEEDEHRLLAERIEEWIKIPPLDAKDDLDYWYDDDCPVCQLMRKMEEENRSPNLSETHRAFKKAKGRGSFVGGKLFENPLDQEVDELLKMAKSKKFKPGIYNFCDRWCEKCKDNEKCFLFAWEEKKKKRKLAEGKTIKEGDFLSEVRHSFELTKRLIERELGQQGFDPKKFLEETKKEEKHWDDDADKRYDQIKCLFLARRYMEDAHKFLEDLNQSRFQFYPELGIEIDFSDIKEEVETIAWYHTVLPIKIWRFLYEKESIKKEKDKELKALMVKDLDKYSALVKKCIQKSKIAWQNLGKKRKETAQLSSQFVMMLNKIKNEFNRAKN